MTRATWLRIFGVGCAVALLATELRADAPPMPDPAGPPPAVEAPLIPFVERPAVPAVPPAPTSGPAPAATATTQPATVPATAPSTGPSTSPATGPAATQGAAAGPKPFPEEFSLLLRRSAFARGVPSPQGQPGGPEANFGLRGVLMIDGQFTALIEELGSKRAQRHKAGESVGPGKIKAITLDTIEYENAGTTRQVSIGQNLLGMPLPPQPPPAPPQPPAPQPGQPGGGPPQPGQPGQPGGPGGPPQGARVRRG